MKLDNKVSVSPKKLSDSDKIRRWKDIGFLMLLSALKVKQRIKMNIQYKINSPVTADQFISLLHKSSLGERRPVENRECMEGVVKNSNLIISAWDNEKLIGIARSMTDFHYACYLSDLAVDRDYQKSGIGRQLQIITQKQLGPVCNLILISAPSKTSYYEHLGYVNNPRGYVSGSENLLKTQ